MDHLLRGKLTAEVETEKRLEGIAADCRDTCDPDTLRAAVSRMEAIFNDHFEHDYFVETGTAFAALLKGLRQAIDNLES